MKKALIVTAFARFVKSFLTNDIVLLQEKEFEVHCAANINHEGAECMPEYFESMGVHFHQVDFSSNKPVSRETVKSYTQIRKILKENNFDFIHCHTPIAGAITRVACKKYRRRGTIVAYTTHGFYFHKYSSKKTWLVYHTIENLMSYLSDAIITINHEDYANALQMHCDRVFYIPGVGVDTNKFKDLVVDRKKYRESLGVKESDFLVLAIGELSKRKNHQIIIEALAECSIPNAVFMICGNAMTTENTAEKLKNLAIEKNVDLRLMGLRDDVPQICKCADIGVMPSTREGLGLSGIEMLASGLPVVASNVHGIVDYVKDGINGYLADPYNAKEFAKSIEKLYDNQHRSEIAKNCPCSIEDFDKSKSFKIMDDIYKEILA